MMNTIKIIDSANNEVFYSGKANVEFDNDFRSFYDYNFCRVNFYLDVDALDLETLNSREKGIFFIVEYDNCLFDITNIQCVENKCCLKTVLLKSLNKE